MPTVEGVRSLERVAGVTKPRPNLKMVPRRFSQLAEVFQLHLANVHGENAYLDLTEHRRFRGCIGGHVLWLLVIGDSLANAIGFDGGCGDRSLRPRPAQKAKPKEARAAATTKQR